MLEKLDIQKILNEFLLNLENPKFITFLNEKDIYEDIESICEGLSIHMIEFKSQESEEINGNKDNCSARRY